jgi:hypothetical protein
MLPSNRHLILYVHHVFSERLLIFSQLFPRKILFLKFLAFAGSAVLAWIFFLLRDHAQLFNKLIESRPIRRQPLLRCTW